MTNITNRIMILDLIINKIISINKTMDMINLGILIILIINILNNININMIITIKANNKFNKNPKYKVII